MKEGLLIRIEEDNHREVVGLAIAPRDHDDDLCLGKGRDLTSGQYFGKGLFCLSFLLLTCSFNSIDVVLHVMKKNRSAKMKRTASAGFS